MDLNLLSRLAALLGTTLFCFSFVLGARPQFLLPYFRYHRFIGSLSFILLFAHPLMLGFSALLPSSFLITNFGLIALYLLTIILLFAWFLRLSHPRWHFIHHLLALPLFFAILHILFIQSDISRIVWLRLWIISWLSLAIVSYCYKIFFNMRLTIPSLALLTIVIISALYYFSRPSAPVTTVPATPTAARCVITINGQQYDVAPFRSQHKGGDIFKCDTDMTQVFQSQHGQKQLEFISRFKI